MPFFDRLTGKKETSVESAIAQNNFNKQQQQHDQYNAYQQPSNRLPSSPRPQRGPGNGTPPPRYNSVDSGRFGRGADSDSYSQEKSYNKYEDEDQYAAPAAPASRFNQQRRAQNNSYDDGDNSEQRSVGSGRFGGGDGGGSGRFGGAVGARRRAAEPDRNELFSGYRGSEDDGNGAHSRFKDGSNATSNRFYDGEPTERDHLGPRPATPPDGQDTEETAAWFDRAAAQQKRENSAGMRRAHAKISEIVDDAEVLGDKLRQQSDKLGVTDRHLKHTKVTTFKAKASTLELDNADRSIFNPGFVSKAKFKRAAAESKNVEREYNEDEGSDQERAMDRFGGRGGGSRFDGIGGRFEKKVMTENNDDNEVEEDVLRLAERLRKMAGDYGEELDKQNKKIERMANDADHLTGHLDGVNRHMKKFK